MKEKNEKLGTWICSQGGTADVFQTKKLGRHFYTRCDCCGLNQGTGIARQQKIFDEAVFINPSVVVMPTNVKITGVIGDAPGSAKPKKESVAAIDFDPTEKVDPVESPAPAAQNFFTSKIIAGMVMVAAAGVGVWMN